MFNYDTHQSEKKLDLLKKKASSVFDDLSKMVCVPTYDYDFTFFNFSDH